MNLAGIQNVMQRMQAIEERFGIKTTATKTDFQNTLQSEMKAKDTLPPADAARRSTGMTALPTGDIGRLISTAADKYGVDPKLVAAVAQTESNCRPDAVSEAGAVGIMQLMPDTAAALGVENAYDPQQNIDGGAKYIKEMLDAFGGDVRQAVAAYNAGPQAVKKYNGVPPYAETQNYVNKVMDIYK